MIRAAWRSLAGTLLALLLFASPLSAQTIQWGVKAGANTSSVGGVPDYYDWVLCCHPLYPDARVEATSNGGFTAGGFAVIPIGRRFSIQTELLLSRRRHSVDLSPYESIRITFARDYVEASALPTLSVPAGSGSIYLAAGPVIGFRVGEAAKASDQALQRGDPDTDLYVMEALPYSAPELLRTSQLSLAIAGGWLYRRLLVELRFTQALQSVFKNEEGLLDGFVAAGAHAPTMRRLVPMFGPYLAAARPRDVTVLAGFRF